MMKSPPQNHSIQKRKITDVQKIKNEYKSKNKPRAIQFNQKKSLLER